MPPSKLLIGRGAAFDWDQSGDSFGDFFKFVFNFHARMENGTYSTGFRRGGGGVGWGG